MKTIIEGILAAGMSLYAVEVVCVLVMANHLHLELKVIDPAAVPDFIGYVKRETAHAINNLLGRPAHTVWQPGYSATLILDADKMVERLVYIYLNPARANLVESIDEYPGVSSWVDGFQDKKIFRARRIPREAIPKLESASLSVDEDRKFAEALWESSKEEYSVEIDPLGWMTCFPETENASREEMAARIRDTVYREERRLAAERKCQAAGASRLQSEPINKPHQPKKYGPRMLCMGSDPTQRRSVISWMKELFAERLKLRERMSLREFLSTPPPGFFAPGRLLFANLNPALIPI